MSHVTAGVDGTETATKLLNYQQKERVRKTVRHTGAVSEGGLVLAFDSVAAGVEGHDVSAAGLQSVKLNEGSRGRGRVCVGAGGVWTLRFAFDRFGRRSPDIVHSDGGCRHERAS